MLTKPLRTNADLHHSIELILIDAYVEDVDKELIFFSSQKNPVWRAAWQITVWWTPRSLIRDALRYRAVYRK